MADAPHPGAGIRFPGKIHFHFAGPDSMLAAVTVATFQREINQALKTYDRHVVCLEKTPEDFLESLQSLMVKAIRAYESRGPHLRHGIALDKQVTVILSQTDGERPLCGIYFNLHSPYQKPAAPKPVRPLSNRIGESGGKADA